MKEYSIFTKEEEEFRKSVQEFIKEKIKPYSKEIEQTNEIPNKIFEEIGKKIFWITIS